METAIRFGWIGETRRSVLCSLLTAEAEDWLKSWSVASPASALRVREIDGASRPERRAAFVAHASSGSVGVYLGGKEFDDIGCYLVAADGEGDDGLAARIGLDAMTDLVARINRRAGNASTPRLVKGHLSAGLDHSRLGAFGVQISSGRLQLELIIDRSLADRLSPPKQPPDELRLVPRHVALSKASLQVSAIINFGSLDLAHLSDLSVGEIIVGDSKLDEPLEIHIEGKGMVVNGYLRRLGEQRAVTFDGAHFQEGHHE